MSANRLRIAYLSASLIPGRAANSVQAMKMASAFSEIGNRVSLFTRKSEMTGDPFVKYNTKSRFRLVASEWRGVRLMGGVSYAQRVRRKIASISAIEKAYDLIYGRDIYSTLACANLCSSVMFEAHTPPPNYIHHLLEKRLFSRPEFHTLVVISNHLREWYLQNHPNLDVDRIMVAPSGAEVHDFPKKSEIELPGRKDVPRVGYCGSVNIGKGVELIIEVARLLPEVDFHIVGGTKDKFSGMGLPSNIHFHGFKFQTDVIDIQNQMDIALAPYQEEVYGFESGRDIARWMSPLKIFEYMSFGIPIVASDLPVIREFLEDGRNARICRHDDPQSWARTIRELISDPEQGISIGLAANRDLKEKYSYDKRAERIISKL